jgi:hypothetical protein
MYTLRVNNTHVVILDSINCEHKLAG